MQRRIRAAICAAICAVTLSAFTFASYADVAAGRAALEREDYRAAVAELEPLARAGDVEVQYRLALAYYEGRGELGENPERVARWARASAQKGHVEAQYLLGAMLHQRRTEADQTEGMRWLQKAAASGRADAMLILAYAYLSEDGVVDPSPSKALQMMEQRAAVTAGDGERLELAHLYLSIGDYGGKSQPRKALAILSEAGERGVPQALAYLAYQTRQSVFLPRSAPLSWALYRLAAQRTPANPRGRLPQEVVALYSEFDAADLAQAKTLLEDLSRPGSFRKALSQALDAAWREHPPMNARR